MIDNTQPTGEKGELSYAEAMERAPIRNTGMRAQKGQFSPEVAKERRLEQNKRNNLARYRATRALALAHPDQFEQYMRAARISVNDEYGPLVTTGITDDGSFYGDTDA